MKKRLLSFLLCLAILAGQIPAAAFAAEDTPPTEPAAAETTLAEQKNATESPAPAAEEAPETQQPAPTGEAAPEQTPDQQPTQQPETEGGKGAEAAPTPEGQPVPPPENVEDQGEAQPEQQPAEGAGPADANSEETEEQPGDSVVTYTITFTDELGTASDETGSEITQAAEGTLVTITAKDRAEEGLLFTAWQAPEGLELADDTEEITTFTMPDSNVELAAEYAPLPEDAEALAEEEEIMLADASPVSGTGTESDPIVVSTFEQLHTAVKNKQQYIKLGRDIDTSSLHDGLAMNTSDLLDFEGQDFVLDLNGKTLHLEMKIANPCFIQVVEGSLTIKDSSTAKTGAITGLFGAVKGGWIDHMIFVGKEGSLTLEGGTFSVKGVPFSDVLNAVCCINASVTIKDGVKLIQPEHLGYGYNNSTYLNGQGYALYTEGNNKVIIDGGEFDGYVNLSGYQDTNGSVQINGGTFKKGVEVRYTAEENNSDPAVTVNGGTFEGDVYLQYWDWKESLYMPYRLNGGTFKGTVHLHTGYYDESIGKTDKPEGNPNIVRGLDKCFGYNAVVTPDGTFTGPDASTAVLKKTTSGESYKMLLEGNESNPVRIIPNAWGMMESVTLDGNKIDYAKDWNGTPVVIKNNEDHTITFKWKDLADELKTAGYRYDAYCMRYTSGDTTGLIPTDQIPTGTEYPFTILKGADPTVYSFDLRLDLKKGSNPINTFANQHIVRLVVVEAPVVTPDPTLTGNVYYTSGIVYGRSISTGTSSLPTGFDSSKLRYQWQRSTDSGSTWADIEGATRGSYTPVAADMGDAVRIRVKITAEGYLGEIVGAAVKVSKAANDNTPAPPAVEAQKDDSNAYTKFKISDFNSNQEYVYTSSPASGSEWPTSGTQITSATVDNLPGGSTYYIYTRYKETDTHTAGSKISSSSVLLDEINKLNRIILTDENGKVYGTYGNGNTIYIKKGTSMTLTATTNPSGANKWSPFTFKSQYGASAPFTVTAPTGLVASGAEIPTVTIRGNTAGTGTLAAEYSSHPAPQSYGTWRVHVYENVSDIGTDAEITVSPSFPDMTMYQGETLPLPEHTVSVYPEGALNNYNLDWRIIKVGSGGATYPTSNDNITLEDGKIKAEAAHTGGEKTLLGLVAIDKTDSTKIISLSPTSRFYVTVTKEPEVQLTKLELFPKQVSMDIGKTRQLSAVKTPANAVGDLTWSSDKPEIASVSSTGVVTTHAQGTAKITVTCGGKSASCTVTVGHTHDTAEQDWVYMDPGTHTRTCTAGDDTQFEAHDFSVWNDNGNGTHSRTCNKCHKAGETGKYTETANHNWQWVVESPATPNAAGKKHEKCTDCGIKQNENTEIPMMTSIKVEHLTIAKPAKDAAAAVATTTDSAYTVANTQWKAADGTTLAVGEKFKPGTVYTASITLHSNSDAVFSAKSTFNAIDGKNAAVVGPLTGDSHAYSIVLTYTFDATEGVHQHTYSAWSSDDTHHWHECTDASCPDKAASVIDKDEHNFVWKIDVPASQASTGTKHEECTVCGKKRNENTVIDKLPGSSSGSGSGSGSHSSSNNNNNTSTEAAAPEAAAPAASAPVTTTTSARTGDSSNLIGWLAVLLISGGAAGAWYTVAKKKKEQ